MMMTAWSSGRVKVFCSGGLIECHVENERCRLVTLFFFSNLDYYPF